MYFKQILIVTIILCFCKSYSFAQNNRFTISTSFQYSKDLYESNRTKMMVMKLTPRISYQINKKIGVGGFYNLLSQSETASLSIPIAASVSNSFTNVLYEIKSDGNAFGLFVQYFFIDKPKFKFFSELEGGIGQIKSKINNSENNFIVPAYNYEFINKPFDKSTINNNYDDVNVYSTSLNLACRYNFYKGLGLESRLNNILNLLNM